MLYLRVKAARTGFVILRGPGKKKVARISTEGQPRLLPIEGVVLTEPDKTGIGILVSEVKG